VLPRLTEEEEVWLKSQLELVCVFGDKEYAEEDLPAELYPEDADWRGCRAYRDLDGYRPDVWEDVGFGHAFEDGDGTGGAGRHFCVYAEEQGSVDRVGHLVHKFLKQFRPDECWWLTYATSCSKLRVGEFGGGAIFVTAVEIRLQDSGDFVEQQRAEFERQKLATA
jgi:hypothetical protein